MKPVTCLLILTLAITLPARAQQYAAPLRYLSGGVQWTSYRPVLLKGDAPPDNGRNHTEKSTISVLLDYSRQIKGHSFLDLGFRLKMIQFSTRFYNPSGPYYDEHYSVDNNPAFDLSFCYAYNRTYRRFMVQPKIGLAMFIAPFKTDTTQFVDFGTSEFAHGYYDNTIKLGYTAGVNVDYRLFRRLHFGTEANYIASFRNSYTYYYRERARYTHEPDATYGLKLANLHIGIHLMLQLGKRQKAAMQEG